jgi:hypothetical protein
MAQTELKLSTTSGYGRKTPQQQKETMKKMEKISTKILQLLEKKIVKNKKKMSSNDAVCMF